MSFSDVFVMSLAAKLRDVHRGRTGLVGRASDSRSGDSGSILRLVGVLFP